VLQRLEIEPPIDESQSRPAPCVFGSVRGAGAARGGGGSFCSRRPEDEVVASGATAGGLPATRAPRVTATTQHYRAPLRTRQLCQALSQVALFIFILARELKFHACERCESAAVHASQSMNESS